MAERDEASPTKAKKTKKPFAWRGWLRALHRDFGYLVVGLTVVYALSGLAVNHISDWNSNFVEYEKSHQIKTPLPDGDEAIAAVVVKAYGGGAKLEEVYPVGDDEIEVLVKGSETTFNVNVKTGAVLERGRSTRFFLRIANWLHLNRGKRAWTWIADGYAILLLFLAGSGLFMLKGKKGFFGRGVILVAIGSAVPIIYVWLSGGP